MFVCEEEDVHTLAGLNLQVDFGDFEPLKTPARLQKKLGDYIPNHAKSLQVSACRQRRDIVLPILLLSMLLLRDGSNACWRRNRASGSLTSARLTSEWSVSIHLTASKITFG